MHMHIYIQGEEAFAFVRKRVQHVDEDELEAVGVVVS
jgi:hypothetical protein